MASTGPGAPALRVGAIGCGRHATTGIWPFLAPCALRLVAVCSRSRAHAETAASRFGVDRAFDDPRRMLDETPLDALIIVLPQDAFGPAVRLAIERRVPAFVEKPAAASAREAEDLARAASAAGVPIVVGYQRRFAAAYARAAAVIREPGFGRLTLASFRWAMGPYRQRFTARDWLVENPVHHFDLARHLVGDLSELRVLFDQPGGEFVFVIGARSASGALVSIRTSTTSSWRQHNESVEVFGEGASVVVDNLDTVVVRPPEGAEQVWRPNYTVPAAEHMSGEVLGFGAELRHFHDLVAGGGANRSDLASAAATLRLAEAIADAAGVP